MPLDLSSLKKAIMSFETALSVAHLSETNTTISPETVVTIKAGVIQNFEFTYELCWKFIQRWIRINKTPQDAEPRTRKDLFRMAARYGLIEDSLRWFEYDSARNITSHTYNEEKANIVYETAFRSLSDMKYLLHQLEILND